MPVVSIVVSKLFELLANLCWSRKCYVFTILFAKHLTETFTGSGGPNGSLKRRMSFKLVSRKLKTIQLMKSMFRMDGKFPAKEKLSEEEQNEELHNASTSSRKKLLMSASHKVRFPPPSFYYRLLIISTSKKRRWPVVYYICERWPNYFHFEELEGTKRKNRNQISIIVLRYASPRKFLKLHYTIYGIKIS